MSTIALMIESDGPGGAERMLIQLAVELRSRGRTVVPVGPARGCGWLADQLRHHGFEPETFRLRAAVDPLCVLGLSRMFRRRRVDVVHSHEFTMAVYGAAAALLAGVPHVITMHGGLGFAERSRRRAAFRWAARRSRATVTVSAAAAAALEQRAGLPPRSVGIVPNGVRPEQGSADRVRRELGIAPEELVLVAIGNLYRVKGHDVLLDALALAGPRLGGRPWRLLVAGRGEEEQSLRDRADRHGLGRQVSLLGYRSDVADLIAAADVFVMPSRSEGLPLALLEAMFAGRAIVASAVGGIPEVLVEGAGLLTPPEDPGSLAEGLERLATDTSFRNSIGAKAHRHAGEHYTVGRMADAYERLYWPGHDEP